MSSNLQLKGLFSKEEIAEALDNVKKPEILRPKHAIPPHPGFEVVELPNGKLGKLAYKQLYSHDMEDLEIELEFIANYEPLLRNPYKKQEAKQYLKFHYKKCVSIISPRIAAGWNRWSDNILELFIHEKTHKIVWGSGNCGKSIIFAMLLYIKWRVRPNKRMVVVASKVVKDAGARVFGYIKEIHASAPKSNTHKFAIVDSAITKAIYTKIYDTDSKKWINNDLACIVNLPIKVSAVKEEIGANLMGKHPEDRLILAFDEGQDLWGKLLEERIFANWYTNPRLDVYAWGNPTPVNYNSPEEWDLLFKLGARGLALSTIRSQEKNAHKTSVWGWPDTIVLHLTMLDSPKDDPDEKNCWITRADGTKELRLSFLGGRDTAENILRSTTKESPAYYSQVLGRPFVSSDGGKHPGVISPNMLKPVRDYPLRWRTPPDKLRWFMGVDPSLTGYLDKAAIACGKMGLMVDGRMGIDLMHGEHCLQVQPVEGEEFTDTIIEVMYRKSLELGIPLNHIALETHGCGEVIRYAMSKHIQAGKWAMDVDEGKNYVVVSPMISPTDRMLFKQLGHMLPAKEMVNDAPTEYWVAVRCGILSRQIFNAPEYILKQFYNRHLHLIANGKKFKIETKDQMKDRGVKSPSDGDALANLIEIMRQHGFGYKFLDSARYTEVYGEEYDRAKARHTIARKLGAASRLLDLGTNMAQFAGAAQKHEKREPVFDIIGV